MPDHTSKTKTKRHNTVDHKSKTNRKDKKCETNSTIHNTSSVSTNTGTSEKPDKKREKEDNNLISEFPQGFTSSNIIYSTPYINLPEKLNSDLKEVIIDYVSPSLNISGNYSHYLKAAMNSIIKFKGYDYDSIFAEENKHNICYQEYNFNQFIDEGLTSTTSNFNESNKIKNVHFENQKKKKCRRSISLEPEKCNKLNQDTQISSKKIKSILKKKNMTKKLLLLDLDETLIHSEIKQDKWTKKQKKIRDCSTCEVEDIEFMDDDLNIYRMHVYIRPYLKVFLENLYNYYDMAIFTAGKQKYVDAVLQVIDPEDKYFKFKLYRESCVSINDTIFIKDLRIIRDFSPENVILMDNSLYSFTNQPSNGMLVNSFFFDGKDTQLISAQNYLLNYVHLAEDVREENEKWFKFEEKIKNFHLHKKTFLKGKSLDVNNNVNNKNNENDNFVEI